MKDGMPDYFHLDDIANASLKEGKDEQIYIHYPTFAVFVAREGVLHYISPEGQDNSIVTSQWGTSFAAPRICMTDDDRRFSEQRPRL